VTSVIHTQLGHVGSDFENKPEGDEAREPLLTKIHRIGSTLSALQLRLDLVSSDSTCKWAQGDNLLAMRRLLQEAANAMEDIEASLRAPSR
jgi:hypothetical protein